MEHEVDATMMDSYNISKKVVRNIEWDVHREIICIVFLVLGLKGSYNYWTCLSKLDPKLNKREST